MRILYVLLLLPFLFSCDNDLTTIGQDFIDNESGFIQHSINLENTRTIKLDSFVTSCGRVGEYINVLYMGRYNDNKGVNNYSGLTQAIPTFQICPYSFPGISTVAKLDSITFNFAYSGKLWGDTLNPTPQTFHLYRLSERPEALESYNYFFYSNSKIPYQNGEKLASVTFIPKTDYMTELHFVLTENTTAKYLWEQSLNDSDRLFDHLPFSFLDYFKGLAIVPDENNNCILGIHSQPDSLYMAFYYNTGADDQTQSILKFPLSQRDLQYNQFTNVPSPYYTALTTQTQSVTLDENNHIPALIEGLSGYCMKVTLPSPEPLAEYTTIVKAELEFEIEPIGTDYIPYPNTLIAYKTNNLNEIMGILTNDAAGQTPIQGFPRIDPFDKSEIKYTFNITDYYKRLVQSIDPIESSKEILISVPTISSSFDRVIIQKTPILKIYYGNYKL